MASKKTTKVVRILARVKDYNGITAGVQFCDGAGETDKPWLIQWFRENGYIVEEQGEEAI